MNDSLLNNKQKLNKYVSFILISLILIIIVSTIVVFLIYMLHLKDRRINRHTDSECIEIVKKKCELYSDNLTKYNLCMNSKIKTPFGCYTEGRVTINDYCDEYKKYIRSLGDKDRCIKENKNKIDPYYDLWNKKYDCLKKSKKEKDFGMCRNNIIRYPNNLEDIPKIRYYLIILVILLIIIGVGLFFGGKFINFEAISTSWYYIIRLLILLVICGIGLELRRKYINYIIDYNNNNNIR
jgi:hypothetical protein